MKEKNRQKGFISIPALIVIIALIATSVGVAVFYEQGKLNSFIDDISQIFTKTEDAKITEGGVTAKDNSGKEQPDYGQIIEQLQQEIAVLQQGQNKTQSNGTELFQQQVSDLQWQLQQAQQKKEQAEQDLQAQKELPPITSVSSLDINQLALRVVKIDCSGGQGSGFLINSNGYIVTNYHVVAKPMYEQEGKIYRNLVTGAVIPGCAVSFTNNPDNPTGGYYWATIPGSYLDEEKDLAILYINSELRSLNNLRPLTVSERNFPFIAKCSQGEFTIGDEIVVLGYPAAGEGTITVSNGIISGSSGIHYKISAKANPGSSGGPVILNNNKGGCFVGVVRGGNITGIESQPYAIKAEFVPF